MHHTASHSCPLYPSDAADDLTLVNLSVAVPIDNNNREAVNAMVAVLRIGYGWDAVTLVDLIKAVSVKALL